MLSIVGGGWNHYSFCQTLQPVTDPLAIPDQQTGCYRRAANRCDPQRGASNADYVGLRWQPVKDDRLLLVGGVSGIENVSSAVRSAGAIIADRVFERGDAGYHSSERRESKVPLHPVFGRPGYFEGHGTVTGDLLAYPRHALPNADDRVEPLIPRRNIHREYESRLTIGPLATARSVSAALAIGTDEGSEDMRMFTSARFAAVPIEPQLSNRETTPPTHWIDRRRVAR